MEEHSQAQQKQEARDKRQEMYEVRTHILSVFDLRDEVGRPYIYEISSGNAPLSRGGRSTRQSGRQLISLRKELILTVRAVNLS